MTMADSADDTSPPPPKKSGGLMGTLMNGIGIFVLTLVAVVLGGFIKASLPLAKSAHGEEGGAGKTTVYYAIDPPLVVNFEDGSVVRFLQITMEVMAHEQKAVDSVQKNIPLIRNNLLLLMSNRNYQSMMSREGKEKLRQEALAEVRAVQKKEGSPDVDDLLFTSFVVQ